MAAMEHVIKKLESLSLSSSTDDILYALETLHTFLVNSPLSARELVENIQIQRIFICLNTTDIKVVHLCVSILQKLLAFVSSEIIVSELEEFLMQGLNHPMEEVRELCLTQIQNCVNSVNGLLVFVDKKDVVAFTARCMGDTKLSCSKIAAQIFSSVARQGVGLNLIFRPWFLSEINELLSQSDTIRYRVFEVFSNIQEVSEEAYELCKNYGILGKLLQDLENDDILLKMNCIELLTQMVNSGPLGLKFLEQHSVPYKMNGLLAGNEGMTALVVPGVVKFFGNLARVFPEQVIQEYPQFLPFIISYLSSNDVALSGVAIDTVGAIASTAAGLKVLFENNVHSKDIIQVFGNYLKAGKTEMRVRVLDSLASIFHKDSLDENTANTLQNIYDKLVPSLVSTLMGIARQPFDDMHNGSLGVMKSLATHEWAQRKMIECPGFLEYLLDRKTEPNKSGKEAKFAVIEELVNSSTAEQVFGSPYFLKLRIYVKDGPFYSSAESSVAMESNQ